MAMDAPGEEHRHEDLRPVEGREADEEMSRLARALAHPTRVTILRALRRSSGATISELVGQLALAQSTVSEHVRVLREAGLVGVADHASRGDYTVEVHVVRRLKALVGSL
jgi:ArsR family transcriptional regulator, arsenate/arsenite/antimonite-responsive transcriptional repressor